MFGKLSQTFPVSCSIVFFWKSPNAANKIVLGTLQGGRSTSTREKLHLGIITVIMENLWAQLFKLCTRQTEHRTLTTAYYTLEYCILHTGPEKEKTKAFQVEGFGGQNLLRVHAEQKHLKLKFRDKKSVFIIYYNHSPWVGCCWILEKLTKLPFV